MRKTVSLLFIVAGLSFAAPVITIVQSIGPGAGSPNFAAYGQNALIGLQNGTTGINTFVGNASGASTYNRLMGVASPNQFTDTTGLFNSWLGISPGAIAGEFGNRLYFGVTVKDNANLQFNLANFVYVDNFYTNAPQNIFFNNQTYNGITLVGISYGPNGVLGGGDDVVYNSGQVSTTLVNELYYRGYSNAIIPPPLAAGQTPQQLLTSQANTAAAGIAQQPPPVVFAGITTVPGNIQTLVAPLTGQAAATAGIPEPSSYALIASGLAALAFVRRRRS